MKPPRPLISSSWLSKTTHLPEAVHDLKNLVGDQTILISVMNGLDSEEYLGSVYGMDKLLYAIAVAIDAVREGNSVTYTNPGKVFFGEADNSHPSERVRRVQAAFEKAGIVSETPTDMIRMLWWKFMVNVGVNQASAAMRAPYGVFQSSPDAQALMDALMREVIVLAQRVGVNLGEQDLDEWYAVLKTLSPKARLRCSRILRQAAKPRSRFLPERWWNWARDTASRHPLTKLF